MTSIEKIKCKPTQLESAANDMASILAKIATSFSAIDKTIESTLSTIWIGTDYEEYREIWTVSKGSAEAYIEQIRRFAEGVNEAAKEYSKSEQKAEEIAEQLRI